MKTIITMKQITMADLNWRLENDTKKYKEQVMKFFKKFIVQILSMILLVAAALQAEAAVIDFELGAPYYLAIKYH
jgi:hypothetical protein